MWTANWFICFCWVFPFSWQAFRPNFFITWYLKLCVYHKLTTKNPAYVMCHVTQVMCNVSCVTSYLSPVTYNLSLMQTATDPHPANSPTIQSKLVLEDPKTQKSWRTEKIKKGVLSFPKLGICSSTRSLQLSWFWPSTKGKLLHFLFCFIRTLRLLDWISLGADSVKISYFFRWFFLPFNQLLILSSRKAF